MIHVEEFSSAIINVRVVFKIQGCKRRKQACYKVWLSKRILLTWELHLGTNYTRNNYRSYIEESNAPNFKNLLKFFLWYIGKTDCCIIRFWGHCFSCMSHILHLWGAKRKNGVTTRESTNCSLIRRSQIPNNNVIIYRAVYKIIHPALKALQCGTKLLLKLEVYINYLVLFGLMRVWKLSVRLSFGTLISP